MTFVIFLSPEVGYFYPTIKDHISAGPFTTKNDYKESTRDRFEKLIQGKRYVELMMYIIGISAGLVILFG